ncbi:noncanonical pyrimidine nucleotidase, YjjG family [Bacteroides sp. 214]|uniref:YjjG family noncanonical pyrimidine nucleotidase n=1 Tax=Bacteroides sp. 214 TaxID=2302935 RepID=UPI0013D1D39A|nr:YjjG family noncanonical pyrimidine nucleotidase [Bacteroides sp. 214]NDW12270.1 noncanonical pyrimidine nucleotidase, YjjG family [Bacteroides sp. 214]
MKYKNLFIDLDDTLWAFSENSRETFKEMYDKHRFDRYFDSFDSYFDIYTTRNVELWELYTYDKITREQLNSERFAYPLRSVGVEDAQLLKDFREDYFEALPLKSKLMPHAKEVLEYLTGKYHLYIISNGFRELQRRKMESSGIDGYFKKIILSEDIGVMKPNPQIFYYALSATQSEIRNSLMIGDNWNADITGAREAGMDQMFYNVYKKDDFPFYPTYLIEDLREITAIL